MNPVENAHKENEKTGQRGYRALKKPLGKVKKEAGTGWPMWHLGAMARSNDGAFVGASSIGFNLSEKKRALGSMALLIRRHW